MHIGLLILNNFGMGFSLEDEVGCRHQVALIAWNMTLFKLGSSAIDRIYTNICLTHYLEN
jgi:hypothetical protein